MDRKDFSWDCCYWVMEGTSHSGNLFDILMTGKDKLILQTEPDAKIFDDFEEAKAYARSLCQKEIKRMVKNIKWIDEVQAHELKGT